MLDEVAERMRRVNDRAAQVGGITTIGLKASVRLFARADARCRGAHDDRHPIDSVALTCGVRGVDEAVGVQSSPRQPVVAAVPVGEGGRQRLLLESCDATNERGNRRCAEVVAREPGSVVRAAQSSVCSQPSPAAEHTV